MQYILTCPFNTTQMAKKELEILWYPATITSQTSLEFQGDQTAIPRVNIHSRVWNKLFLVLAKWRTSNFEDLFAVVKGIDWGKYILKWQPITIQANTKQSVLTSLPSIQSITKKAVTQKLTWTSEWWREEDQNIWPVYIQIIINRDFCFVLLNTSWDSLHNRWYRQHAGSAPLKENLAAALMVSSGWKFNTPFIDPFCWSGSLPIETALFAKNIAPWVIRSRYQWWAFQNFARLDKKEYDQQLEQAKEKIMTEKEHTIIGYDIDPTMIEIAKDNAKNAWVEKYIHFENKDFMDTDIPNKKSTILTNPPYGERMSLVEGNRIYEKLVWFFQNNSEVNWWFITNAPDVQAFYNPKLWKETKIFNGPLECVFYKIARL